MSMIYYIKPKRQLKYPITTGGKSRIIYFLGMALSLGLYGCFTTSSGDPTPGGSGSKTPAPVALFSFVVGQKGSVTFINASTNASSYAWDFGDVSTSIEKNPNHTYTSNGTFNVSLEATGTGGKNSISLDVTITDIQTILTYKNTTQTPINITINGTAKIIPVGGTMDFSGTPGSSATGTAFTSGSTSSGTQIGLKISWDINDTFSASNNIKNLSVSGKFFFLKVKNTTSYQINKVYVNYQSTSETLDQLSIPSDGITYSLGYYSTFSNSDVRFESSSKFWYYKLYLSGIQNEIGTVEVSGGGETTTGQVMFWHSTNSNCGAITVKCAGLSAENGSYFSAAPECGASGCATFTLAPGTYSYTASCTSKTWSGSVTVTANGCYKLQLLQ